MIEPKDTAASLRRRPSRCKRLVIYGVGSFFTYLGLGKRSRSLRRFWCYIISLFVSHPRRELKALLLKALPFGDNSVRKLDVEVGRAITCPHFEGVIESPTNIKLGIPIGL